MNGIDNKNVINLVHPLKSKSSYFQKNNKSFEKIMNSSQSLQTVQPKSIKTDQVNDSDINTDLKKLVKLIDELNEKLNEIDSNDKDEISGMVDLLSLLQSIIQKQLESSINNPETKKIDSNLSISNEVLMTDSKGFMQAILSGDKNFKLNGLNNLENLSEMATNILSKLKESISGENKIEDVSTVELKDEDLKRFLTELGQFLTDKGISKVQIKNLSDGIEKVVTNSLTNLEVKTPIKGNEVDALNVALKDETSNEMTIATKINSSETDNQSTSFSNQAFSGDSIKQFALYIGKTTNKAEANQFVRDFQNIIQKSAFTNEMGQQKIFIKLFPENLGRISIELVKNEHGMMATIIASSAKAKELLQSNMDGLKQAFQLNNLQIDKIDLFQSLQADRSNSYLNQERENQNRQQNQDQKQSKQSTNEEEVSSSFLDQFMKEVSI